MKECESESNLCSRWVPLSSVKDERKMIPFVQYQNEIKVETFLVYFTVFTLTDTKTETQTDKKWFVQNCVEVFMLLRDRNPRKLSLGSAHVLSVSVSVPVLVLVSQSVNEPLPDTRPIQ